MFSVGDRIIYGSTGVCQIENIVGNELTGIIREYYVMRPVDTNKSIIYVPVDNEKLVSRMREVPSAEKLKAMIKNAKNDQIEWVDNHIRRSELFHEILSEGEIPRILVLFKTLNARSVVLSKENKHLPKTDERIYKECQKLLCSEISAILNVEQNEALNIILNNFT